MDAIWYYAEGDKAVGPLSLPDITAILSRVSDARNVFVWRDGFPNWIKAEDVPDLAPYVIKPPASPVSPPRWLRESIAAPTFPAVFDEARAKHEPSGKKDRDLIGIGGWLILVAIGQVLGPLRFVHFLFGYYVNLDNDLWTQYPITLIGEAVLNTWVVAIMGCATYLFFTKSELFPDFFIYECVAYITRLPLVILFKEITLSAYMGQWIPISLDRRSVGEWIATIILAAIWLPYSKSSKRVANTFRR
jgi:uncharacterized protein DUF2569/uncharacterized protein DUF4339